VWHRARGADSSSPLPHARDEGQRLRNRLFHLRRRIVAVQHQDLDEGADRVSLSLLALLPSLSGARGPATLRRPAATDAASCAAASHVQRRRVVPPTRQVVQRVEDVLFALIAAFVAAMTSLRSRIST